MSEENKSFQQLEYIADAITDNIINTPDTEILDEVKTDHGDCEYEANIMRTIIRKATVQVNKDKFSQAKQNLKEFKVSQKTNSTESNPSEGFTQADFDDLTMAARDGKSISLKDMDGMREDWEDLKKMTSWKDNNDKA